MYICENPSIYCYTPEAVSKSVLVFNTTYFFPKELHIYSVCDNTCFKDALLIMISLEKILSGRNGINQTTYQILMGRGQRKHLPCLVASEFMHSISLSQKLFKHIYNSNTKSLNLLFFSTDIAANCFSASRAAY